MSTRAEIKREGGLSSFWGWVQHLGPGLAKVRLSNTRGLLVGEKVQIEVQGPDRLGSFEAEIVNTEPNEILLRIHGEIRYSTLIDPPRLAVHQIFARLRIGEGEAVAEVVDASARGAGLLVAVEIPVGIQISVEIRGANGPVTVVGESRYCNPLENQPGRFRVGLKLDTTDRVSTARWAQALEESRRNAPERRTA